MFAAKTLGMRSCRIVLFFLLLISSVSSYCQQSFFIYIQNDQRQPFFVKLDRKVLSSSNNGYLIIPKLPAGPVQLSIGFPKSAEPDLRFTCIIDKQDAGFLLRSFGEKGYGLFNLQTLDVVMQLREDPAAVAVNTKDPFAEKLANVVGDPSIAQTKTTTPAQSIPVEPASVDTTTSTQVVSTRLDTIQSVAGSNTPAPDVVLIDSTIAQISTPPTDSTWKRETHIGMLSSGVGDAGLQLVYVDTGSARIDTIQVLIPVDHVKPPVVTSSPADTLRSLAVKSGSPVLDVVLEDPKPVEPIAARSTDTLSQKGFLPMELPSPHQPANQADSVRQPVAVLDSVQAPTLISDSVRNVSLVPSSVLEPRPIDTAAVVIPPLESPVLSPSTITSGLPAFNSDCKAVATEDDFLKLRKKMAAGSDDDDMISIARKAMKAKCYSTFQIRNLSVLFLNDGGRYGFLDMAYAFASDTGNYPQLVDLLKDLYYINRFKAMIRQ